MTDTIRVPITLFENLLEMAAAHVEDIASGIHEGIYLAEENRDLTRKQSDIDAADQLIRDWIYRGNEDERTNH